MPRLGSTYRKAELEVAQTVTMLSRKPGDAKLLKKVHKLVKEAQKDRKNMDKDHVMLSSLEKKIASLQVGKSNSFSSLKDESVSLRKRAGVVEETVKALKQESRHLRTKAEADIAKAKPEMSAPDKLHQEAQALRDKYSVQLKHISALQASLAHNGKAAYHHASNLASKPCTNAKATSHHASTLNPKPSTLNPKPSTLNPKPSTLNPKPTSKPRPITPKLPKP